MPNYRFVAFGDIDDLKQALDQNVAAFIFEPIQGEGGVVIPSQKYLKLAQQICHENQTLLIADEVQTGFGRTGPMFATEDFGVEADFVTMAKGIAGGFPFGAFATPEAVAERLEVGDHGGTYCGNPLGCAVSSAVIKYLVEKDIPANVAKMGAFSLEIMSAWQNQFPDMITRVRGKGLLLFVAFKNEDLATRISEICFQEGLFVRQTQKNGIRIFPALNITKAEMADGLEILHKAIETISIEIQKEPG